MDTKMPDGSCSFFGRRAQIGSDPLTDIDSEFDATWVYDIADTPPCYTRTKQLRQHFHILTLRAALASDDVLYWMQDVRRKDKGWSVSVQPTA